MVLNTLVCLTMRVALSANVIFSVLSIFKSFKNLYLTKIIIPVPIVVPLAIDVRIFILVLVGRVRGRGGGREVECNSVTTFGVARLGIGTLYLLGLSRRGKLHSVQYDGGQRDVEILTSTLRCLFSRARRLNGVSMSSAGTYPTSCVLRTRTSHQ
jgi:hypothetical protein